MASKPFKLTEPIDVDGERRTELQVRLMTVDHYKAMMADSADENVDDVQTTANTIGRVTGLSPEQVGQLALVDFWSLQEIVSENFPASAREEFGVSGASKPTLP